MDLTPREFAEGIWRRLSRGRRTLSDRDSAVSLEQPEPLGQGLGRPSEDTLLLLLDKIEATALSIYEAHGLPTRTGHYAWSSTADGWRFLAEDLTAEERWALVMANSTKANWRFGSLVNIGSARSDITPALREASRLLSECEAARLAAAGGSGGTRADLIERAVRLGADWRQLEMTKALPGRLRLTPTIDEPVIKRPRRRRAETQLK